MPRSLFALALLVAALIAVAMISLASAGLREPDQMGLGFDVAVPQGEFRQHVRHLGFGGSFQAEYRLGESPVSWGGVLSYLGYGSKTRHGITSRNKLGGFELLVKLSPTGGLLRPYLFGLAGARLFYTMSEVEDPEHDWVDAELPRIDQADVTLSYGGAAGIQVAVVRPGGDAQVQWNGIERRDLTFLLDIGAYYIRNGRIDYLREGSVGGDPQVPTYEVHNSRVDMLVFHLGVAVVGVWD